MMDNYNYLCVIQTIVMVCVLNHERIVVSSDTNIQETCLVEIFQAQCSDNQILIITHAMFGRMKTGRCVKISNNLGCSKDVHSFLSTKCSGRKSCSIPVTEISVYAQLDCLQEMSAYLEASYRCQSVFTPPTRQCSASLMIESTSKSQFISSVVSKDTSCGLHQTPYILEAKPGQVLEITLHDYSIKSDVQPGSCSVKYGYIMDDSNDDVANLCGGEQNKKKVLQSVGKRVQILLERAAVTNNYFLIEFKAIGCPDLQPPKYGWKQNGNKTVTIGCNTSTDKWTMKCVGNIWLGIMKECPAPVLTVAPTHTVQQFPSSEEKQKGIPHVSDNHLFAIGIACITIIICVTTVVLGVHCVKRYELSVKKKNSFCMNTFPHNSIYKPVINNGTLPLSTGLPQYTMDIDTGVPELPRRTASMVEQSDGRESASPDYFNLVNIDGGNRQEKIYQSMPREGVLLS